MTDKRASKDAADSYLDGRKRPRWMLSPRIRRRQRAGEGAGPPKTSNVSDNSKSKDVNDDSINANSKETSITVNNTSNNTINDTTTPAEPSGLHRAGGEGAAVRFRPSEPGRFRGGSQDRRHVYIYIYIYHMYIYIYICVCVSLSLSLYTHLSLSICIYIYIYTYL